MCSVTIFKILYQIHNHESDRVNVHTFCSPDLPLSGTLGPAVKFQKHQEFLLTAHTSPAQQTTAEEVEGTSHVGNFGGFCPKIIDKKGYKSFLYRKFLRSLPETEIFRFQPRTIFVSCGICTTGFEFDIGEIFRRIG